MPEKDAFVLDNLIPRDTSVDTRGGSSEFATGVGGAVESLEVYAGGASAKMLAFGNGSVFNVSVAGAVGAALQSGRTSNKISSTMFSNAGNQYLLGVSGADAPFSYDGTTFANLTITGLTGSQNTLHGIFTFKGRVYLAQQGQLGFYYLAVGAIQGAASYFDLSQVAKKGGSLAGIAGFSADSGNGPADYIVFMTTEGEYLVYGGTDPSNAATFALVSRYYSSAPIGRKGWFNFRDDLYIISDEGIVSMTQIRTSWESGVDTEYISAKLGKYISNLNMYSATHGWCAVVYPRGNLLLVNAPTTSATTGGYYQFVLNTTNTQRNAWGRFTGWNALCWAVFNKRIYFGAADGRVMLADEGFVDDGADIQCDARQAYNYFDDGRGSGAADKQFHFATFIVRTNGTPPVSAELNINFEDVQPQYAGSLSGSSGTVWDVADWDAADWGGEGITQNFTVPFGKIGYAASIWLRASISAGGIEWFATRVVFEKTNGIVLL
ncbi:MAG: hypothetical protein E6Q97_32435 [Desulfurellales bacterium]|nr:MAG: hypothetical protein E6Q97_32435 [Desulfurellales bacterium]